MNSRLRGLIRLLVLLAVLVLLFLAFPLAFKFAEGAARNVMRLWWLILLAGLGIWLIWGVGRKPKP